MSYNSKSVLLLGVGGVSMHQLAQAYLLQKYNVFGYDLHFNEYTKALINNGAKITNQFDRTFLNVDFCVATGAIKNNNKYIKALKNLKIPIYDRAEILADFAKNFSCVIAVAGTHGKSTTASLIYEILREAGKKVSCHIGADVFAARFNLDDEFLVVEACEYNKSFLYLYPHIAVVTNVEAEHMDSYKSIFNLRSAFLTLTKRANMRFAYSEKSTQFLKKINDIKFVEICKNPKLKPRLKGEYNLKNISLAIEVCSSLGINQDIIFKVVNMFNGVPRRYQCIGGKDVKIYIDYAHHPTEVAAFIDSFNGQFKKNLIVFQPHTYSRTKMFLNQFISALKKADNLIIFKEYPAREKPSAGYSAYKLFLALKKAGVKCKYVANYKRISKYLKNVSAAAFVGAGDINLIANKFK